MSVVLLVFPAVYPCRPHKLGHWYDRYNPASARLPSVMNPIVMTWQVTACSVGIGVQAHDKALNCEVRVSNPWPEGTQIPAQMRPDYLTNAKDSHFPITLSFDGWGPELLSLPAQLGLLANPSHRPCELERSCELCCSVAAGLSITTVSNGLVGKAIEPVSSPGQSAILSRSTFESAGLHVSYRLVAAYTPIKMCFTDSTHCAVELVILHDQSDSPAEPACRFPKLARSNGPNRLTTTHLLVPIHFRGSTCQSFQVEEQPIILTGTQALNIAFECDIYLSSLQLGRTQILHRNGVSHLAALSDLERTTLMWLSYDPGIRSDRLPITSLINSWIACWHMPHRSAAAHSPIVMRSISSMCQKIIPPIRMGAHRVHLDHQSIQVKGQHIVLTFIPVLNGDLSCGIRAVDPQLGGTQLTTSMWLGCVPDVKGSRLPTTSPINGWITSLAQPSYLTVTVCCPIEMMCSFESYSSSVVHLSTIASLQLDPPTDPLCNPITLACSCVPGHSGPECSCHLCHSVAAGWPIVTNLIRLPCQAVELTSSSTSSGSPTVSMHSFLKSAHLQSAHHLVAAHALIVTCSTNSMRHTIKSISSHDWWDPPAVPACQLLELVRLHGPCCSAVAYPSITTHSARTMCHATGQVSLPDQPYSSAGHPPETAGVSACHVSGSSPLLVLLDILAVYSQCPYELGHSLDLHCSASGGSSIVIKSTGSMRRVIIRSALMVAQALNQVLGCDIYTPNPFLGGIQITTPMWLGYVPGVKDGHLSTTPPINDWDRKLGPLPARPIPSTVPLRSPFVLACSLMQKRPELEMTHKELLLMQLPGSCLGPPNWRHTLPGLSLRLEMSSATHAPQHHPREMLYPPATAHLASKLSRQPSNVAHLPAALPTTMVWERLCAKERTPHPRTEAKPAWNEFSNGLCRSIHILAEPLHEERRKSLENIERELSGERSPGWPIKPCLTKRCCAQLKATIIADQVYTQTASAIGCTSRQANGVTGKDRYASWAVPDYSKLDNLRTAWSCSGPRPVSSEGHYRYKNDDIKILGISLSAGRLNATLGNRTSLSISKGIVVLTQPEDSQWYLFQAECLLTSAPSATSVPMAALSEQSSPTVLLRPFRWFCHLIKQENPLPRPAHSAFPISYCVVGLS
ncbi:uncharacterized protein EI90DRAFT_3015489 [Cantharellus anzutake]|uniref:uncharacterized protein n=1 Tax=Cantharellus anzutake TaxID=1750568 RepID=UPI0019076F3B|nr:uncharacterized protein EI90DRAFT_3015489 [Cantharellus anzutake]KAF8333018.1 hypothetical protein EI90DRAFT_3015489 [Cantharellus anzutake]